MKKRILFIIWSFSYGGGAEKVLSNLLNAVDDFCEPTLLEVEHFDVSWEPLPEDAIVLEPIIKNGKASIWERCQRFVKRLLVKYAPGVLRQSARGGRTYDAVVAFNYAIPTFLLKKDDCSICWVHTSIEDLNDNPRLRRKQKKAFSEASRIVAISKKTKDSILELYPQFEDKVSLIYNGFNIDEIERRSGELPACQLEPNSILCVGRLEDRKDPLRVARVFRMVLKTHPDAHLYYLGRGHLEGSLRELVAAYKLEDWVHFLGHVQNPYPYMAQSSCLVSLSKAEGFPTIFVECLTLGLPFVSSFVAGFDELSCGGRFGTLVQTDEEAACAIGELLDQPINDELVSEMRQHAEVFSTSKQASSFIQLIEEAIGEMERE